MVGISQKEFMIYKDIIKRIFDFVFAFIGIIILLPMFVLLIILLSVVNLGNPFFFQLRPGKNRQLFKIIKFKTMNDNKNIDGVLLPNSERITTVGKIIRKLSLDEIPQLINIIKGEMSLIGPRPLLQEYLPLYDNVQKRRHDIRPGITGWAQINGRNSLSWSQKFEYDLYYVENVNFKLDLQILIKTFRNTILAKNINASKKTTMVKFNGMN
tara:strand:- start:212 stop:847 length:636 start_codon:yes stop_codon:yes gene_type:complete